MRRSSPAAALHRRQNERRAERAEATAQAAQDRVAGMMRRFEAASDTRFGKAHWGRMTSDSLHHMLVADLATLRRRCGYEIQNNSTLKGMVESYKDDIVGKDGPRLQIISEDKDWARRAEAVWRDWWAMPDVNRRWSGPDLLRIGVGKCWDCGEFFWQQVDDPAGVGPVTLRLQAIPARRIETPLDSLGGTVSLGVQVGDIGEVQGFHITRTDPITGMPRDSRYVEAGRMLHFFVPEDEEQYRGVPFAAPALPVIAELRDYDREVLAAARMAAMLALLLYTEHKPDDADPVVLGGDDSWELEAGVGKALPPGYKAEQLRPQQPMQIYAEYKRERQAEIGRASCMPGMIVRLDSRDHNYSSARFDSQAYDRHIAAHQGMLERVILNRLLGDVLREAWLARGIEPTPADMRVVWVWPKRPHVDPVKESVAANNRMKGGTTCQADECADLGKDVEEVRTKRQEEGLPSGPEWAQPKETARATT